MSAAEAMQCQIERDGFCVVEGVIPAGEVQAISGELLAVIERASVLVAPDTGPAHMGTTVGTPVVGLYAASNPLRSGPYLSLDHTVNNYAEALQAERGAREDEVRWGTRVRGKAAMETITLDQVIEKLEAILG